MYVCNNINVFRIPELNISFGEYNVSTTKGQNNNITFQIINGSYLFLVWNEQLGKQSSFMDNISHLNRKEK